MRRFGWIDGPKGSVEKFFGFEKAMELREEYKHPFWKTAKSFTVDEIDMSKFDFSEGIVRAKDAQSV